MDSHPARPNTTEELQHGPDRLIAIRALVAAVVLVAGIATASLALAVIGGALALWALAGLIKR